MDMHRSSKFSKIMLRRQYLFLFVVMLAGLCFIFTNNKYIDISFSFGTVSLLQRHRNYGKSIINTEGCTIPDMDPMDSSITNFVKYPTDIPKCPNASLALLGRNRTTIWVRKEHFNHYNITADNELTCCYRVFFRPDLVDIRSRKIDDRVKYDNCTMFNDTIDVGDDHEFVRVKCSVNNKEVYNQFYLFATMKEFSKHGGKDEIIDNTGYNVLIIGVDNVSRLNLFRTMPKTVRYLQKKRAIDMLGYNKVGQNTFPNLIPMLIGVNDKELKKLCYPHRQATFDNCPFVWEWYKQAGYYTALVEDMTLDSTFNYAKRGFMEAPTDYYPRTLLRQAEKHGSKRYRNVCTNDMYYYKVLLNYIEDITWRLKSSRLFGMFWENSMSHDNLNWPRKMDRDYLELFINMADSGYLEETIVFFVSDHGIRWGQIRTTKQGHFEERLPFLYILMPNSFQENYKKAYYNLIHNSQRLTTPYDVHETLMDLTDVKNVNDETISKRCHQSYALQKGISLFLPIFSNRTCKDAGISNQWCTCKREVNVGTGHPQVIEAAQFLVKFLNHKLRDESLCARLVLDRVLNATEIQVGKERDYKPWREFLVVVRTAPSRGVFEGLLRLRKRSKKWALVEPPSRLNQYGDQSLCVDDYTVKEFCYCLHF